ncbi:LamG domain-containing protein, partial [Candidatus Sumerlaeota bacterium]|nr:LamG domain-containing protein [Candidatus Sumerlaeota bacterium]
NGKIDDFRLYDTALSDEHIAALVRGAPMAPGAAPRPPSTTSPGNIQPPALPVTTSGAGASALFAHYQFENTDFETSLIDSVGANHGTIAGQVKYMAGRISKAIEFNGIDSYATLPSSVADCNDITVAAWVLTYDKRDFQRIFDFGNNDRQYLFLAPDTAEDKMRFSISINGTGADNEQSLTTANVTPQVWTHVAVKLEGDIGSMFVNGVKVDTQRITLNPTDVKPQHNFLAKSQFAVDPMYAGLIDDFRVYHFALPDTAIAALADDTQSVVTPYMQVNGGDWERTDSVTINSGDRVTMGPQPRTGGSWSWSGPGVSGGNREQTVSPQESVTIVATYTDPQGLQSRQIFNIIVR